MPTSLETNAEELKAERQSLADEFNKNPQRLHLAIKIKRIDDQIAERRQAMRTHPNAGPILQGAPHL